MRIRGRRIAVLVSFMLLLVSAFAMNTMVKAGETHADPELIRAQSAEDWWPMFRHDPAHSGFSPSTAPDTNQTLWNYTAGGSAFYSLAVAYGRVYVGSGSTDNKIYALDSTTGTFMWSYTIGSHVDRSPAVADGRVYVASSFASKIHALNATTGASIWNYTADLSSLMTSSPVVADGKVFVGSYDKKVYALDAATGASIRNYTTGDYVLSSPALADGKLFVGSFDNKVYAFNATTGVELWTNTTDGPVISSPAVAYGRVFVGSTDNKTYAFDSTTGNIVWTHTTDAPVESSPAVAYGSVFVGSSDNSTYALNASDGELIWSYPTNGRVGSSPAVADGKVFVGSGDKRVYALNATTGALIWSYTTDSWVGSPAVADGKLFVDSDYGVYAFGTPVHDVAVTDVTPSRTVVLQGNKTSINVTVANQGNYPETFNVTLNRTGIFKTSRSFRLSANLVTGWNDSIPGPTITANQGDLINLTLVRADPISVTHNFFIDYNGDQLPSPGEPTSANFNTTTIYPFFANRSGTFTYYCGFHNWMKGAFIVNPPLVLTWQIGVQQVSPLSPLALTEARIINFTLDTTGIQKGNYTISAHAGPVSGETDIADNVNVDVVVRVALTLGDVDANGKVDIKDLAAMAKSYGANYPDPRYVANYDLDDNGKIDIKDLARAAKNYGKNDPPWAL